MVESAAPGEESDLGECGRERGRVDDGTKMRGFSFWEKGERAGQVWGGKMRFRCSSAYSRPGDRLVGPVESNWQWERR